MFRYHSWQQVNWHVDTNSSKVHTHSVLNTLRYEGDLPIKSGRQQREIPTTLRLRHDTMKQDMYKIVFIQFSMHVSRIKRCCIPLEFVTSIYVGATHETVYTLPVLPAIFDFDVLPISVSNSHLSHRVAGPRKCEDIAVGISLLTHAQAEIENITYVLPVNGDQLWFTGYADIVKCLQ